VLALRNTVGHPARAAGDGRPSAGASGAAPLAGELADGDASLDVDRWANDGGTRADQDRSVIAQRAGGRR